MVTINLSGVANAQRLGVTLKNVCNGTISGDVLIPMGVLAGDTPVTALLMPLMSAKQNPNWSGSDRFEFPQRYHGEWFDQCRRRFECEIAFGHSLTPLIPDRESR